MICPSCGAENPDNAPFCSLCHRQFASTINQTMGTQQQAPVYQQMDPRRSATPARNDIPQPVQAGGPRQPAPPIHGGIGGIKGTEGMTLDQLRYELHRGGRFVVFQFCISALIVTFKKNSPIHFIRAGEGTFSHSGPYSLVSFLLGWWGIPFGFIFTPSVLFNNFKGGRDVTREVASRLFAQGPYGTPGGVR